MDASSFFTESLQPWALGIKEAARDVTGVMDGKLIGYRSGWANLDSMLRLIPGELTVVGARAGTGKCLGKGTRVVMYDGTLKPVEDVQVGDLLMGADSTPRHVLSLGRGREMMYWVHQTGGISYRVNEGHVLSLRRSYAENARNKGDILNIPVSEVIQKGRGFFSRYKGYKVPIQFAEQPVPVDPYFLGLWLGDGKSDAVRIYNQDREVVAYLHEYAEQRSEVVTVGDSHRCPHYTIGRGFRGGSYAQRADTLQALLRTLNVLGNKHIPHIYLRNTTECRLALLAGLLDSDGHLGATGYYEITLKLKRLVDQAKFLADSLGYRTHVAERVVRSQHGTEVKVWRLTISGDLDRIPCRISRKCALPRRSVKDWRMSGITIEPDCVDDYYGFVLDGDHLFLLEDMTVTHNTAFAMQLAENVMKQMIANGDEGLIVIFSAEMSSSALAKRTACGLAGVPVWKVDNGEITKEEGRRVLAKLRELEAWPFVVDQTTAPTVEHMIDQIQVYADEAPIRLVMFDYMELAGEFAKEESQRVAKIGRGLHGLARKYNCPVVAISQLNRDIERRAKKKPMLSDLMHGGEREPDRVVMLVRPSLFDETEDERIVNVYMVKNRNAKQGETVLLFDAPNMRFRSAQVTRTELNPQEA